MATDGWAAEIVGRQAELGLLDRTLAEVMGGEPRLVCVEGAAGIGKTTLLKAFREAHSEVQHLVVSGEERESVLALGVIDQVYRRLSKADRRTQLPIVALGAPVPDAFMVGLSLLEVLGELDDASPVVLTIEDAQWADANSLQAIAFAFRRMAADRVMVLLTVRAGHLAAVPQALHQLLATDSGVHLTLTGLEPAEVRLLAERRGLDLSDTSVERLRAYTEGNPLYIGALLREVGVASIEGQDHLPPAPQSFTETVRAKLDRGSSGLRALIEAAAVLGVRSRLDQLVQMTAISEPFQVLDEAAAAGLLQFRGTPPRLDITFTHPLVAAAAYHAIPLESRARLHKLASSVVDEELIALRHRLAASTGSDPELAREFEAYGISQIATNSWTNAATALLSAADLTDSRANKERCVLDAIDCELLAGELKSGHDLTHFEPTARRSYVMARTFLSRGQPFEAEPLYKSAWGLAAGMPKRDPELEVRIASWYASLLLNAGRSSEAIEWATRALSALPEERRPTAFATTVQLMALACRGDAGSVDQLVGSLSSNPALVSIEGFELLLSRGVARMWSDRVAEARGDLGRAAELARQRGATHLLVPTLMHLADAESRLGDFDAAVTHAELAVSVAHESDQLFLAPAAHAVAAYPYICRGAWSLAERHLAQAQEIALIVGDLLSVGYAAIASARLALMRQRWEDAATALSPLLAIQLEPTNEPGLVAWQLFYVEALVHLDQLAEAGVWLERTELRLAERKIDSQTPVVAMLKAAIAATGGNSSRAVEIFEAASQELPDNAGPLELGRFHLEFGSLLRRLGRRRAARAELEKARALLERLRSEPLLARCDAELAGSGLRPVHRTPDERNLLTSQELAVARLVADGHTNRQVAKELFLSPRTVDYHLVHVYGKLGINSRSQLARQFSASEAASPAR